MLNVTRTAPPCLSTLGKELDERRQLREVIKKLKGSSQKVKHAQILLKADIEGFNTQMGQSVCSSHMRIEIRP